MDWNFFVSFLSLVLACIAAYYARYEHNLRIRPSLFVVASTNLGVESESLITVINHGGNAIILSVYTTPWGIDADQRTYIDNEHRYIGSGDKIVLYCDLSMEELKKLKLHFNTSAGDYVIGNVIFEISK